MIKKFSGYSNVQIIAKDPQHKKVDRTVQFKSSGYKIYFNAQHIFIKLTSLERSFFDFLCEIMETDNTTFIDVDLKRDYVKFMGEITGKKTKIIYSWIGASIKKLKTLGLIFSVDGGRSYYQVNPKYVFAGTEKARKSLLKDILEHRIRKELPLTMLIDTTESDFLK